MSLEAAPVKCKNRLNLENQTFDWFKFKAGGEIKKRLAIEKKNEKNQLHNSQQLPNKQLID